MHVQITNYFAQERMGIFICTGVHNDAGIAPADAQEGDEIMLISGVSMPMIMRRHGQGFRVIGPAYIEQAMKGDIWKALEPSSLAGITLV